MKEALTFCFIACFKLFSTLDPCDVYEQLPDMERRFTSYQTDTANGELEICDRYLPSGEHWYKAEVDMPTTPPSLFDCGTTYPIWFNGSIPKDQSEISIGVGCLFKSTTRICDTKYSVSIKNCGQYRVYALQPTARCPEAFCFGIGVKDDPPTEVLQSPIILADLVPKELDGSVRDVLIFKCYFGDILKSAYYQVTWILDGVSFRTRVAVKNDLNPLHLLDEHLKSLGKMLSCVVRPKNLLNGRPGTSSKSTDLFAGIKVKSTTLAMKINDSTTIDFHLTVPFGCLWKQGATDTCKLIVEMRVPDPIKGQCSGTVASHSHHCRTEIDRLNWNKTTSIIIKYKGIGTYALGPANTFIMQLAVSADHELWNGYMLPPIQVNIFEDTYQYKWAGKTCKSRNDPHMLTFDGRKYEHQKAGTYTLYEHVDQNRKMEVQIKLKSCNPPYQANFCNCGVAVRAGGDVFIVDMCSSSSSMGYRTCHDKILDVRKYKKNEKLYNIFFPTGTKVELTTSVGYMNVDIKASVHDFEKTRGLCGYLNNDCADDLRLRDNSLSPISGTKLPCDEHGHTAMYPHDFSNSWRINNVENNLFLLEHDQKIDLWNADDYFCDCPKGATLNDFHCSPATSVTCIRDKIFDKVGSKTCHEIEYGRKRRSTEFPWKSLSRRRRKRSVSKSNNYVSMSPEEALKFCSEGMGQSSVFKACDDIPNMSGNTAVDICALDIQLTNSSEWTEATMETFKSNCIGELQDNSTLQETSDDGPSVAQTIEDILCPGFPECTNNGKCVNGTCACDEGFVASDCSIDKSVPPEVFGVLGDGLCDTSEIECDTAFVVGENFGSSDELSCNITEYEISELGQKRIISSWIANATLETIMEVHCFLLNNTHQKQDVHNGNKPFMKGYSMGISYDKINFGEQVQLVVYDSKCQVADFTVIPPVIGLKKSTCFIDGQCYFSNEGHTLDVCRVCDPMTPYQWSTSKLVQGCIKREENKYLGWIAGPALGGVAALVIIVILLMIYYKRARAKVKTFSS